MLAPQRDGSQLGRRVGLFRMTTASLVRAVLGRCALLGPQPLQGLLIAQPRVRCGVLEQGLRRLPTPVCIALFRLFADALVSNSVSIRPRSGKSGPRLRPTLGGYLDRRQAPAADMLLIRSVGLAHGLAKSSLDLYLDRD